MWLQAQQTVTTLSPQPCAFLPRRHRGSFVLSAELSVLLEALTRAGDTRWAGLTHPCVASPAPHVALLIPSGVRSRTEARAQPA